MSDIVRPLSDRRCKSIFANIRITYHFLHHIHDFRLHQVKALRVTSGCTADDVVDFDIIFFLTNTSSIHGIGELNEDRVFLHDTLDVLAANSDDPLVVLVWNVKGDRSWHLLLDKIETIFDGIVLSSTHVDVEVVFIEAIKDDLHVT